MTTKLPQNITVDVDSLEREESYDVFSFVLNGRRIELVDPALLDWKDLLEIENPVTFLKYGLSEEKPQADGDEVLKGDDALSDKEFFKKQAIPGWKLGKIISLYTEHYGLDQQGNGVASRI